MTMRGDILAQWMAEEEAVRAKMASPGITSSVVQQTMSGLEFLRKSWNGDLPSTPMAAVMNAVVITVEHGRVVFQSTPTQGHFNTIGSVHGGYYCTLLDSAMAYAVLSTLPPGMGYATLELKVNLVRALSERTGPVRTEGRVIHAGRQIGLAEARMVDVDGKLCGQSTSTCMLFPFP